MSTFILGGIDVSEHSCAHCRARTRACTRVDVYMSLYNDNNFSRLRQGETGICVLSLKLRGFSLHPHHLRQVEYS